jgi:hypothetical protein
LDWPMILTSTRCMERSFKLLSVRSGVYAHF